MCIEMETAFKAPVYGKTQKDIDRLWRRILKDKSDKMIAFSKGEKAALGVCSILHADSLSIELGCDIAPNYQGQGFGSELMKSLISITRKVYPESEILIKMNAGNAASIRIAEKNGGICISKEPALWAEQIEEQLEAGKLKCLGQERVEWCKEIINMGQDNVLVYRIPR